VAPRVNKDSTTNMFWYGILQQLILCWWNRPAGSITSTWTHYKMDSLQHLMSVKLKCFFCGSYCSNGTWHTAQTSWKTMGLSLNSVHTLLCRKTNDSWQFLNILWYFPIQMIRMLCTVMILTVTDCTNINIFFTCWTVFSQNKSVNTTSELVTGWSSSTCQGRLYSILNST
jgi:hypothetical protein